MICQENPSGSGGTWQPLGPCLNCDHVTGDQTQLICNGNNVANANSPCQNLNNAACDFGDSAVLLTCVQDPSLATQTWQLKTDCLDTNMTCSVKMGAVGCR
jgi:hypothetical protein